MARTKQTARKPSCAVRVHPANFSSSIPPCSECGSNVWKCTSRCGQRAEHVVALCRGAFGYLEWEEVDEILMQATTVGVDEETAEDGNDDDHPRGEAEGGSCSKNAANEMCDQQRERSERRRRHRTAQEQADLLDEVERCNHQYVCQGTDCGSERDATYVHSRMNMCECGDGRPEDDGSRVGRGGAIKCTNIAVRGMYCRKHRGRGDGQGNCGSGRKRALSIGEDAEPRKTQHYQKAKPQIT